MAINEIEIPGSLTSFSFRCLSAKADSVPALAEKIRDSDQFNLMSENPVGFHDVESIDTLIRGYFSIVVPFGVEHLEDGIIAMETFKRIETCEFFMTKKGLFVSGKTSAQKILEMELSGLTGYAVSPIEFEQDEMSGFQENLSLVKSIGITNPKVDDIRTVKLSGKIELSDVGKSVIAKGHGVDSVSGLLVSPLGLIGVAVSRKGGFRLTVKKGFILTTELMSWLLKNVKGGETPAEKIAKPLTGICKKSGAVEKDPPVVNPGTSSFKTLEKEDDLL